jgi:hypothetical protein
LTGRKAQEPAQSKLHLERAQGLTPSKSRRSVMAQEQAQSAFALLASLPLSILTLSHKAGTEKVRALAVESTRLNRKRAALGSHFLSCRFLVRCSWRFEAPLFVAFRKLLVAM